MKENRRNFLKLTGLTGLGVAGGILKTFADTSSRQISEVPHFQRFNMSGYAAPKIETVRVGFIGLGNRGHSNMNNMTKLGNVEIKALCDVRPEYAERAKKRVQSTGHNHELYTNNSEAWKKLCDRKDIDLIYIAT